LHRSTGQSRFSAFDAHLDTWDTYYGAPYTHGTPFRRAGEEGLLDFESCLHVGVRRPLYSKDDLPEQCHFRFSGIIRSEDFDDLGTEAIIAKMLRRVAGKAGLCFD
jgi:agmatinase